MRQFCAIDTSLLARRLLSHWKSMETISD